VSEISVNSVGGRNYAEKERRIKGENWKIWCTVSGERRAGEQVLELRAGLHNERPKGLVEKEKIIWNFDNVQKAYATRGYEAKNR
jgi:hypothetical protein